MSINCSGVRLLWILHNICYHKSVHMSTFLFVAKCKGVTWGECGIFVRIHLSKLRIDAKIGVLCK